MSSNERLQQLYSHLSPSYSLGLSIQPAKEISPELKERVLNEENHRRLEGKVCIVTGAGSAMGIGRSAAFTFAKDGAAVIYVTDIYGERLPKLVEDIKSKYPQIKCIARILDATDEASVAAITKDAVKEHGRLDVFFASAGSSEYSGTVNSKEFMESIRLNALSAFLAIKHAGEAMKVTGGSKKESGGSIILTSSVAGVRSGAGPIHYSAAKAAVINLAMTGATSLANTNIRVNAICPGLIETDMTKEFFDLARKKNVADKIGQLNPLGRYGIATEIANVASFLASDESSYINGQAIRACGGLSASLPIVPGRWQ
ncbi:uncharacterized protein VTP21DRAFT_4827 [Calcarisporiella thermophila]|uniref:uncharacterized protein n=1 Tax=Calcarisporiella thermophila TaxID=911321 RepID=UPI00374291F6